MIQQSLEEEVNFNFWNNDHGVAEKSIRTLIVAEFCLKSLEY